MAVEVNVEINTTEAEVKLRALEARALQVASTLTSADRTGLPTSRLAGLRVVERPGVTIIQQTSPIGQIKSTEQMPLASTWAALGAGAALSGGGLSGSRSSSETRDRKRAGETHRKLRQAGNLPGDIQMEYPVEWGNRIPEHKLASAMSRASLRTARRLNYPGSELLIGSGILRMSGQDMFEDEVYRINRRYQNRAAIYHSMGHKRFLASRLDRLDDFLRAKGGTRIAALNSTLGLANVTISAATAGKFVRAFAEGRRAALESGNYNYDAVLKEAFDDTTLSIGKAANKGLGGGLAAAGAILEGILVHTKGASFGKWGIFRGEPVTDADIAKAIQGTIDYWSGAEAERNKALAKAHDAWSRGYLSALENAKRFTRAVATNNAQRALEIGFSYGPGKDIERQIRSEIQGKVIARAAREYEQANPEPTMKRMGGKKD